MSASDQASINTKMTDTKTGVSQDCLLKGKANFITWKREFERAAKAQDVLDLLTGDEPILNKPKTESYLITVPRSSATRMTTIANRLRFGHYSQLPTGGLLRPTDAYCGLS